MGVKEEIQYEEQQAEGLRDNRKKLEQEGSEEQKMFLYGKIKKMMSGLVCRMKVRLFFLGFSNKELVRKLYVVADLVLKGNELMKENCLLCEKHEKGEDENILEYRIAMQQLEKKVKILDKDLVEKGKLLHETRQKPLYGEIGAMLALRHIANLFILLEKNSESTNEMIGKLGKESELLSGTMSPLGNSSRHRPTNKWYPI